MMSFLLFLFLFNANILQLKSTRSILYSFSGSSGTGYETKLEDQEHLLVHSKFKAMLSCLHLIHFISPSTPSSFVSHSYS